MSRMKSKVIVLGINPSYKKKKNPTLARLHRWMAELHVTPFSFSNIVHKEGVYNKSDIDYNWINECCQGYDHVFALGDFVSSALAAINIPHYKLPHPSPLNRNLNNKKYEWDQLKAAARYIHGTDTILRRVPEILWAG